MYIDRPVFTKNRLANTAFFQFFDQGFHFRLPVRCYISSHYLANLNIKGSWGSRSFVPPFPLKTWVLLFYCASFRLVPFKNVPNFLE
jgi:hypothetical protein